MSKMPPELRYSKEHEWARVEGDAVRVGITDHAQDALGDVVYVSLPEVGASVSSMAACAEVESTKSVSEVFAPVSGVVTEVNADLRDAPQLVNEDPYGRGWIFTVSMNDPSELDGLLDASGYQAFVGAG